MDNDALGHHDMRAVCGRHKDEKCTLNQQSKTKPLARLWAFLACQNDFTTKADHKAHVLSADEIAAARDEVERVDGAGPWLAAEIRHAAAA